MNNYWSVTGKSAVRYRLRKIQEPPLQNLKTEVSNTQHGAGR